jgi:hypothetical protein
LYLYLRSDAGEQISSNTLYVQISSAFYLIHQCAAWRVNQSQQSWFFIRS